MPDQISYVKSSGGDVDAGFVDALAATLAEEVPDHNPVNVSSGDLNTHVNPEFILVTNSSVANLPVNENLYCMTRNLVISSTNIWLMQTAWTLNGRRQFIRTGRNRNGSVTWNDWHTVGDESTIIVRSDNDANSYTTPGTWVLGATTSNVPSILAPAVLMLSVEGYEDDNGSMYLLQTLTAINSNVIYTRTIYSSRDDIVFNPWQQASINGIGFLNASDYDLDDYVDSGSYVVVGKAVVNCPTSGIGLLSIKNFNSTTGNNTRWVLQEWVDYVDRTVYVRTTRFIDSINEWNAWARVSGESVTPGGAGESVLTGRNVVFLGDSIFGNNQSSTGIANLFSDLTGANVANFAFGGTRACKRGGSSANDQAWAEFDGRSIAEAIATNDYSGMEGALTGSSMTGVPNYFSASVAKLKQYNWAECDYIVTDWGTNDYTASETVDDYTAALKYIIETILGAYPNIVFVMVTPFMRFFDMSNGIFEDANEHTIGGQTLTDFVEATQVLSDTPYFLQVVDCYRIGINKLTRTNFFSNGDWTHHNENGRLRVATYLAAEIH